MLIYAGVTLKATLWFDSKERLDINPLVSGSETNGQLLAQLCINSPFPHKINHEAYIRLSREQIQSQYLRMAYLGGDTSKTSKDLFVMNNSDALIKAD